MAQQAFIFSPEGFFFPGQNEVEVFRNGQKLIVNEDFLELTQTQIQLTVTTNSGDIIIGQVRGRQFGGHPGLYDFKIQLTPVALFDFVLYTIPEYTPGNNSLRVYRNGKLLSLASGEYEEPAVTIVKVFGALSAGDTFEFIVRGENSDGEPLLFEEIPAVGGVNEVFTLASPYLVGTDTLEVYRNGKRLANGFGHDEITDTTVRFNGVSTAGDNFTFMVRASSPVIIPLTC